MRLLTIPTEQGRISIPIKEDLNTERMSRLNRLALLHKNESDLSYINAYTNLNTNKYKKEVNLSAMNLHVPGEIILKNKDHTMKQLARLLKSKKEMRGSV